MSQPIVAIVGRPNVGKSTLFNKIVQKRVSIVENSPGVTRDRIYGQAEWAGKEFSVIDTGGIEPYTDDEMLVLMRRQAQLAIDTADVIIFIADAKSGVTANDYEIAAMIRKTSTPYILAVNKVDGYEKQSLIYEFYNLNLGEPFAISAEHSLGIGDLLDEVITKFKNTDLSEEKEKRCRIAVAGRPNVGKSTLINCLLGEERVIVSDIPGTTRDAIDTDFDYEDEKYTIIDTAGLRRKNKIYENIERYSTIRSIKAIEESDLCLLMLDATQEIGDQDLKIAGLIEDRAKAVIIVVNKWDAIEKETNTMKKLTDEIKRRFHFIDYAPVLFISALNKSRTDKLMPQIQKILIEYDKKISTGSLNNMVNDALLTHQPPSKNGKRLKIYYATQTGTHPPSFTFFVNDVTLIQTSYRKYLQNRLREAFEFEGVPILLKFKSRGELV
ncbi:MAG: ribosome biogenesis GTPase Der [Eubacteriaceae bacterium]|nr:ribosome biogenesis GTPase Der [Eubacteriaceae bacterium]